MRDKSADAVARLAALTIRQRATRPPDMTDWSDPVGWLHDRVRFRPDEGPTAYQEEALAETPAPRAIPIPRAPT